MSYGLIATIEAYGQLTAIDQVADGNKINLVWSPCSAQRGEGAKLIVVSTYHKRCDRRCWSETQQHRFYIAAAILIR